ncbi:MAG: 5-formyltetrahydrofolate cyclo-ligase [Jhaorihella sp.]
MPDDPDDRPGTAPCFAHELIAGQPVDAETWRDVSRFRRAERTRLLALRKALAQESRAKQAQTIADMLDEIVQPVPGMVIAGYWPIRSELDMRAWMTRAHEKGARVALPVVVEKGRPLEFRHWVPRCAMVRGVWNIPVPAEGAALRPDVVISPVLGVDREGYRLGNGGGYYDRTLAALDPRPQIIGIGQDFARLATIFPMHWDIAMDRVILGDGTAWRRGEAPAG